MVAPLLRTASAPRLAARSTSLSAKRRLRGSPQNRALPPLGTRGMNSMPCTLSTTTLFLLHSSTALAFASPSAPPPLALAPSSSQLHLRAPSSLSSTSALSRLSPPPPPALSSQGVAAAPSLLRAWSSKGRAGVLGLRSVATDAATRDVAASTAPPPGKALPLHPKLTTGVLPNGLRYCIMPNAKPKGRFYMNLEVHVGSVDEEEHQQGIAHFVEHALFLGTERFPTQKAMKSLLRRLGMAANADANAFTDFRSTTYTFSAPVRGRASEIESPAALYGGGGLSTGGEQVAEEEEEDGAAAAAAADEALGLREDSENSLLVLELLHEMALKATITDEAIDRERGAILSELADRNNVAQRTAKEFYSFAYSDTVLPSRFPIGLEELIKEWDAAALRAFYEKHYFPANMCLYVTGDIDPTRVAGQIADVFGGAGNPAPIPQRRVLYPPGYPGVEEPATTAEGWAEEARAAFTAWPARGSPVPHEFDKPRDERFKLLESAQVNDVTFLVQAKSPMVSTRTEGELSEDLIDSIITMVLSFRLHALRMGMTDPDFNSIGWSLSSEPGLQCTTNAISVSARPDKWRAALYTALQEIGRLALHGVTAAELEQSLTTIRNHFAQQAEQRDQQTSSAWMRRIMDSVHGRDALVHPDDKFAVLQRLCDATTLEAVNARTCENLTPFLSMLDDTSKMTTFVQQPPGTPDPVDKEKFLAEVERGLAPPGAPTEVQNIGELLSSAELDARVAALSPSVVSRSFDEPSGIGQLQLSNGVRVAYIRNEARRNEMRIRVSLLGGRAIEEPGAVGSMSAAAALWINGGAGGHAAEAITRYCSMWGMSFDAACGEEATKLDVVSSSAEPGQLARALALAALYLGEPDCETSSFARFMVRVDRSGKQLVKSLQRSTSRAFTDELFGDGERFRHQELTAESTAGLTLEAARDTLLKQLAPENMVVSVAGDFDAAELEAGLIRFFGTLQGVGPSREAPVRVDPARLRAAEGVFRDAAASPTARTGRVFVPDEANRSFQLIGFPSVGRWGTLSCADGLRLDAATATAADVPAAAGNGAPYCARMHVSRCLAVAMDVVQSRLFQEIREQRGLVYGISFGWRPFRHIDGGYCTVQLMPKQGEEAAALEEVQKALRAVLAEGITDEEFDAAKTPLVTKVEEKLVSNGFMLQLLEDLGYPESRKDLSCVRDVPEHYAALTKPQVERAMRECLLPGLDAMVVTLGVSGESDPAAPGADAPAP